MLIQEPVPTGTSRRTPPRGVAVGVRRLGDISLLDVHGPLPAVAGPAREAVLAEWVESPAAVICDLSDVRGPVDSPAMSRLALLGAHVRQWPGIPIGLICPDRDVREGLARAAEGRYLAIAETGSAVWGELSAGAATATVRATLAPEPRSARAARDFVAHTCSDWGCSHQVLAATLIASELVTNAVLHARTPLTMSVSRCGRRLRVGVRDHDSTPPTPRVVGSDDASGRGMQVVEALCEDWGVLSAAGGKLVWAILPAQPDHSGPRRSAQG